MIEKKRTRLFIRTLIYYIMIYAGSLNKLIVINILLILFGCGSSNDEIYLALSSFDRSLDSLIVDKAYDVPKYCILDGDTLKNSPKQIEVTQYIVFANDSIRIDANCHVYQFENNQLVINSSVTALGRKYVQKYVHFKDEIDNALMHALINKYKHTDTIVFGYLIKYNAEGRVVKRVRSGVWREFDQQTGLRKENEDRVLEVYSYDLEGGVYTTFQKVYSNKKYHVDDLRKVVANRFELEINKKDSGAFSYSYLYDEYGNWVVKRRLYTENPEVYYRKITYE